MVSNELKRMECMEVWGGNRSVERFVRTTGLDVWMFSRPQSGNVSGGDVYYLSSCASGRITRILLADVSGHGEAVAERAEVLRRLMRKNINRIDQSELVKSISQDFAEASTCGVFATALVITFFAPTSTLTISNAGHPQPLAYDQKLNCWQRIPASKASGQKTANFPLGIEPGENYSRFRAKLKSGDRVLCYTDGLCEVETAEGGLLGTDGLIDMANEVGPVEPDQLLQQLLDKAKPPQADINSADDVSLVLIQPNQERVALKDNLLAPFRVMKSFLVET